VQKETPVRGSAIQRRISAYMAAADSGTPPDTPTAGTPTTTLTPGGRAAGPSPDMQSSPCQLPSSQHVSPHGEPHKQGAGSPAGTENWHSSVQKTDLVRGLGGSSRSILSDSGHESAPLSSPARVLSDRMEVDDLRRQLQQKDDEIAMLVHLANTQARVPITAEMAQRLSAAVAHSVGGHGEGFQLWLHDMAGERHRLSEEYRAQADNATLLIEAREALAQWIVHKVLYV